MFSPSIGDRVRIDIPDETDPDHHLHGRHGTVTNVIEDDAGEETRDERDSTLIRVEINGGKTVDLRWRDVRAPFDGE